jgi:hypothetical protein
MDSSAIGGKSCELKAMNVSNSVTEVLSCLAEIVRATYLLILTNFFSYTIWHHITLLSPVPFWLGFQTT